MGYTHYFYIKEGEIKQQVWNDFLKDVKVLIKAMPEHNKYYYPEYPLAINGCFKYEKPKFTKQMIWFNGGNGLPRKKVPYSYQDNSGTTISGMEWQDQEHGNKDWNDLGHETFVLTRKNKKEDYEDKNRTHTFRFCKTQYKPYDMVVQGVLILAKYHFKDDIKVSSDGNMEDWKHSFEWTASIHKKVLGLMLNDKLLEE